MPCYLVISGGTGEDCGCGEYRKSGMCPGHEVTRSWLCGEELKVDLCGACHEECGGRRRAEFECDYPVGKGQTCDLMLCARCRKNVGTNRDFCPVHYAMFRRTVPEPHGINVWPPKRADE